MWRTLIVAAACVAVCSGYGCLRLRSIYRGEHDGHYCVCNSTHCDEAPILEGSADSRLYRLVSSSKGGLRYSNVAGYLAKISRLNRKIGKISIDRFKIQQKILGFGGAITDSTGINIGKLSTGARKKLMQSYFGSTGSEYNFIRTPMGGTDFSTRPYSYLDKKGTIQDFSLQEEDFLYKIPYIQWAQALSKRKIKLLTAPWSAHPWMKTKDTWLPKGKLRKEYWQLWADYFASYFSEYRRRGLVFWGTSPQNEPQIDSYVNSTINGMAWTAEEQRDWVSQHLVPTLNARGHDKLKILVADDNRPVFPEWVEVLYANETVKNMVHGTAMHWYVDKEMPVERLDRVRELAPEKMILYTEACVGVGAAPGQNVILGSWQNGEDYAKSIIESLAHGAQTWIDWNMALDMQGGPTWAKNFVDSPIIVNAEKDEFYKQPMFYVLGHFSKYVTPDSSRISSVSENLPGVRHIAFLTAEHATVIVILNTNDVKVPLVIDDLKRGTCVDFVMPPKSIHTVVYW